MDRRSFLGALAALPIVARLGIVKEAQLTEVAPNITPFNMCAGSGEIKCIPFQSSLTDGSGAFPRCSG